MHGSFVVCKTRADQMVAMFQRLGFTVNFTKSVLVPTQRIIYFGLVIDTVTFKIYLPDDKVSKILQLCLSVLNQDFPSVRVIASLIGLLVHAFHAVLAAPLHYRALERDKIAALRLCPEFSAAMKLSKNSKTEIQWWLDNLVLMNGKSIRPLPISLWLECDASLLGWGSI